MLSALAATVRAIYHRGKADADLAGAVKANTEATQRLTTAYNESTARVDAQLGQYGQDIATLKADVATLLRAQRRRA